MFALRTLVRSNANIVKNVPQARNMSAIAVPARNKVSKGELIFLGAAMVIGWSAVPAWVLVNLKHYRDRD